ncbi:ATP-binding cassette domain-containing protein [Ponticoccus sp. SC2-23]|uniref:ABC transporter ATP-binding protein n=1 Tax=Alexandriicola marinus TaxID=2081710 RepID=UPI000FDCC5C3|nr:oligopeptide/dipeptide ABC transporter ATP-binding protein [Alexandriicola marinus]MBM1218605.1 ATP-binding cassette domain-containing protein [Ponticoccus sp. SC6-9]MBM1224323.1 ATP-binding cassette domain-containing protein [Ponticoccus sp. SC6-15]MBM1229898.1 ATP-binding cassette domain-containing protein [Ponticoccus sp. SC6-38]MBM1233289.1 ATP-binding cassette domain-containing protein [Ponticoccus sp. SC6-45]MBM1236761.1 ATP-binding cassette domain-containing protein [Ponticoccus sp. 
MSLIDVRHLTKTFPGPNGTRVQAVSDVSFSMEEGEVLGVVGESGCGKSTLGHSIVRLIEPDAGEVAFGGLDLAKARKAELKHSRRDIQIIFQDPFGSLNPRHKVGHVIAEPLIVHRIGTRPERLARVKELLDLVGLPAEAVDRYPHEFSGGQRQRIAIARALALNPKLIVADESVSALDVSIQSQILNLIAELREKLGLSIIFISHDLSVIRHVSDRIAVMYLGRLVEIGPAAQIMTDPRHPYTQALLAAVPKIGGDRHAARPIVTGEPPDPANPPQGCAFHGRCPKVMEICRRTRPELGAGNGAPAGSETACHLYTT